MKIRLGYVAMTKTLDMPFKTMTYTEFSKQKDLQKLKNIISYNLKNTMNLLKYNKANEIHFYRMTSNLIPLATHKEVSFDYITPFEKEYQKIGRFIKKNNMRVDMHPDQYTVLNSTNKEVYENTLRILDYHLTIYKALQIENPILILHVGSSTFGKENAMKRFISRFHKLNDEVKKCIVLENDDKVYTADDVLFLCQTLKIPMVLDFHHYRCNKGEKDIKELLPLIFETWKEKTPKIHFSSPKNKTKKEMRSHHDFIDVDDFLSFLENIKFIKKDFDIMIEAKEKDQALFKLTRALKYKTDYLFLDDTSFLL